jgi:malate/lactate dehydrogenase
MPRKKVSIVGAGNVGAKTTYYIAEKVIADLVMVDIAEGMTRAKALDFLHAGPLRPTTARSAAPPITPRSRAATSSWSPPAWPASPAWTAWTS